MKKRRLFCEISPLTYKISLEKEIFKRHMQNLFSGVKFARSKSADLLPVVLKKHQSLIRRTLNNVDTYLQENKAKSLAITAPKVSLC